MLHTHALGVYNANIHCDRFIVLSVGCLVVACYGLVGGFDCAIVFSFLAMPGLCKAFVACSVYHTVTKTNRS